MTKQDTILELLRRYRDAECTLVSTGQGSGDNPKLMPGCWNQSFRELERVLQVMSSERPKQTRHLLARYVDATLSRKRLIGRRTSRGDVVFVNLPHHSEVRSYAKLPDRDRLANEWDVVVASWPGWVRASVVDAALQQLVKAFRGEPYLPNEMLEEAA